MTADDYILVQTILMIVLVSATIFYAYQAKKASDSAKASANASVKMAEEMREQRVMASRPVMIQKAVPTKIISSSIISDHFEIYNAGNGPAIELEIFLLDKEKKLMEKQRETFLRAGDPPIAFHPCNLASHVNSTCYLLCRYQSIRSRSSKQMWYQTWLPFKPVKSQARNYIYVTPEMLEFSEVFKKESY